ncbi:(R)-citramalate synthase [Nymphon striatum]|nr:(R)-citramalate synthase [Nymphon striatum]
MTKRAGISASNDPGLNALIQSPADAVCFVAKSWDYHVRVALGCTNEENLECITQSIEVTIASGKEAYVDCEHFFDGYKANPDYALACAKAAFDAGARWIVLCDTNGGTQPVEVREIVAAASKRRGRTCSRQAFSAEKLKELTHLSRAFDELLNRAPATQAPYVGASAFATKAGIHASAILKDPATYEHVKPESVGNMRKVMVSDQGGKSNFLNELKRHGIEVAKDDPRLDTLIAVVKEREAAGYSYEAADASFELLARRTLGEVPNFFEVDSYRVGVERRHNAAGQLVNVSEAVVKLKIDGEQRMSVSEGHGPVNALDLALRKDLGKFHAEIADLELVDYKVRILNGGTEAVTRVLIESADQTAKRWWTIGVSDNIIDASFMALMESITFKLMKNRKQAGLVAAE